VALESAYEIIDFVFRECSDLILAVLFGLNRLSVGLREGGLVFCRLFLPFGTFPI
jgi:hypothetical protein